MMPKDHYNEQNGVNALIDCDSKDEQVVQQECHCIPRSALQVVDESHGSPVKSIDKVGIYLASSDDSCLFESRFKSYSIHNNLSQHLEALPHPKTHHRALDAQYLK